MCKVNSTVLVNTLEYWQVGAESKDRIFILPGLIPKGLGSDFFILLLLFFQATKDEVLKKICTASCKETHLAYLHFVAGAEASLDVTQKSLWPHMNISPACGNVPPHELLGLLASSLQGRLPVLGCTQAAIPKQLHTSISHKRTEKS